MTMRRGLPPLERPSVEVIASGEFDALAGLVDSMRVSLDMLSGRLSEIERVETARRVRAQRKVSKRRKRK